ncbi:hypothetical protein CSC94_22345 [Zhengella mangrovi]|uniref:Uncharacterized protein n=1 Tax=Zhengella mangrovi TaxID=1982044 RepID=A0A2G1QH82_9HYPH|nr:hypothetical protein [Zhengella mangrovi]PHP64821.1 hypothetical protein CSC94_22345 [Zhengella mangrovi]
MDVSPEILAEYQRGLAEPPMRLDQYKTEFAGEGLLLGEAFRILVLEDKQLQALGDGTSGPQWSVVLPGIQAAAQPQVPKGRRNLSDPGPRRTEPPESIRWRVCLTGLTEGLLALLRDGTLGATGELPDTGERKSIDPGYWSTSTYRFNTRSHELLRANRKDRVAAFRLVRVFLPASQRIDPGAMHGPLGEVFRELVLRDPGVRRLQPLALGSVDGPDLAGIEGQPWPISPERLSDGKNACPEPLQVAADNPYRSDLSSALSERMDGFLAPLRTGQVTAQGQSTGKSGPEQIPPATWDNDDTWIDPVNHRVGLLTNHKNSTSIQWLWESVSLEPEDARSIAAEADGAGKARSKGGRPTKYPWEEAMERLTIRLGDQGHPESGAELARMLINCMEEARCAKLPSEDQASTWLKNHRLSLWNHVTGRGQNRF